MKQTFQVESRNLKISSWQIHLNYRDINLKFNPSVGVQLSF